MSVTVIVSHGDKDRLTLTPGPFGFVIGCCRCDWRYGPAPSRRLSRKWDRHSKRAHPETAIDKLPQWSMKARLESGEGHVRSSLAWGLPWIVIFDGEKNGTRTFHEGVAALLSAAGVHKHALDARLSLGA